MDGTVPRFRQAPQRYVAERHGIEKYDLRRRRGHDLFLAFRSLRLFPKDIHLFEARVRQFLSLYPDLFLDVCKAAQEALDGIAQALLWLDVQKARQIDKRKQQIAHLFSGPPA